MPAAQPFLRSFAAAGAAVLCATAVACGDSDDEPAAAGGTTTAATPAGTKAEQRLEVLERGLATRPPTEGPKAQKGKAVWAISCGDFVESCSVVTDYTVAAGEDLGWKMTRFDAKVDPARAADGIRQAIAAKADAVVVSAFDCALVKAPLAEAKKAGVKTYGSGTANCDDPVSGDGSEPLYTFVDTVPPGTGRGWSGFTSSWGADKARYAAASTDGKAKAINLEQSDLPSVGLISKGFATGLGECTGCEVVETVEFTGADLENGNLTQQVANALSSNPTANVLHMPVDGLLPAIAPAVQESGRSKDLLVVGGEGNFTSNIDEIRKDGAQDAALAFDLGWESYAQMDDLNRSFAGEEPVYGGWGYSLIDRDTNLPPKGKAWNSKLDYVAAYRKLWGS